MAGAVRTNLGEVSNAGAAADNGHTANSIDQQAIQELMHDIYEMLREPEVWLDTPNVRLGGQSPRELIDAGDLKPVQNIIGAAKYGLYS